MATFAFDRTAAQSRLAQHLLPPLLKDLQVHRLVHFRRWLADDASADPRPGGRFRLEGRVPEGQVYVMSGEYREFVPERRLVMSWTVQGPGGAADRVETLVTVELRETGSGGTEMDFREEYVEEEMFMRVEHVPSTNVELLIRRPVGEVFRAFVDPEITTRFWFTKSSGKLDPGTDVRWEWEMYDVSATVNDSARWPKNWPMAQRSTMCWTLP